MWRCALFRGLYSDAHVSHSLAHPLSTLAVSRVESDLALGCARGERACVQCWCLEALLHPSLVWEREREQTSRDNSKSAICLEPACNLHHRRLHSVLLPEALRAYMPFSVCPLYVCVCVSFGLCVYARVKNAILPE